jgi:hypothetical protein
VLDAHLVCLLQALMLNRLLVVGLGYRDIIRLSVELRVLTLRLLHRETVVCANLALRLVLKLRLRLFLHDLAGHLLEVLARIGVLSYHSVLVRLDGLAVGASPLLVQLALALFLLLQALLVPVHQGLVLLTATPDLVSEVGVLVGDLDLLLQAHLLVVELAQAVLEHLSL